MSHNHACQPLHFPAKVDDHWRSAEDTAREAERERLRDWLDTQERVTGWWLSRLGAGEDDRRLLDAITVHQRSVLTLKRLI